MLCIELTHAADTLTFPLPAGGAVLGSAADCDLVVPFPGVSRRHARLVPAPGGVLVTDLGSRNGLVLGRRRVAEHLLLPGERLRVGRSHLALAEHDAEDVELELAFRIAPARGGPRRETDPVGSAASEETHLPSASPAGTAPRGLFLPDGMVLGPSPAMASLLEQLGATVRSSMDVLLLGETGTGKELLARAVHASGGAASGPFVAINCAAIPAELLEAELFGIHGRVATGVDPRAGRLLQADGGTLFLDEVGELPDALQAKLLRFLQEREVQALGAAAPRKVDVRVVSASNRELERETRDGRFRADLFYRLSGLLFLVPPLRERVDDLPALVTSFAERAAGAAGKRITGISRRAFLVLAGHDWPGNVRELENAVRRAVLLCPDGDRLRVEHFERLAAARRPSPPPLHPAPLLHAEATLDLKEGVDRVERELIRQALERTGRNRKKAAALLGISRGGLLLKMKRLLGTDE